MKKCPSCQASNPEAATWCSLCLKRFDQPAAVEDSAASVESFQGSAGGADVAAPSTPRPAAVVRIEATAAGIALPAIEPEASSEIVEAASVDTSGDVIALPPESWAGRSALPGHAASFEVPAPSRSLPGSAPIDQSAGAVVQRPAPLIRPVVPGASGIGLPIEIERDPMGRLIQRCSLCGATNPIEVNECTVCGADFLAALREPEVKRDVSPTKAMLWGLVPGGGFIPLGKRARFLGHLGLVVWLLFLSFLTFLLSPRALLGFKLGFATMGVGVWIASAIDAGRIAGGRDAALLSGKRPIVVFVASLAALFVLGFVLTWMAVRGQSETQSTGMVYAAPLGPVRPAAEVLRG